MSVYGTGTLLLARGFSWQWRIGQFATNFRSPSPLGINKAPDLPRASPYRLRRTQPTVRCTYLPASPHCSNEAWWHWNINQLSIAYGFRPRLRSRLTLRGRTLLGKPWAYGGRDSHPSFRYLYRHSHFHTLQHSLRYTFDAYGTLPYHDVVINNNLTCCSLLELGWNLCDKLHLDKTF